MRSRSLAFVSCALSLALGVAACGDDESPSGGQPESEQAGVTEGAKVIDVDSMEGATGDVTLCAGKDTTGSKKAIVEDFNERFGGDGLKADLLEFSTSADEQRTQFVQRQEAKSGECDVFQADVIWTAEFAGQKWLYDMSPYIEQRTDEFIPSTLATAELEEKYWAVPWATNAGFLFYRTDQVDQPPATWQEAYEQAQAGDGIVYQGAPYEGLTVDFLELAFAAGGEVLSEDGKTAVIDSPENLRALQFMVDGVENGIAARGVTTYMEEEARRYFESGKATLMRNWPYAFILGNQAAAVKGKFAVMPFPEFEGGGKAGILGGGNFVISTYSENPGAALKLIDFATSAEMEKQSAADFGDPPVLAETYEDPAVEKALPFAAELKQAVEQAQPRPVSPVYPQISQAIYENVNSALAGKITPEEALKAAQDDIQAALETF